MYALLLSLTLATLASGAPTAGAHPAGGAQLPPPETGARAGVEVRCLVVAPGECLGVTLSGAGPDVVLIPGLFGSAFSYRKITARLNAAGYRSIVIEPLGIGSSGRPRKADYSLTAQGQRIHEAIVALGVGDAVVISHAMGTSMVLRMAHRHPNRIRAVISLEGGPAEELSTPGFRRAMRLAPLLKLIGGGRIIRGRLRKMLVERSASAAWVTDEIVTSYTEDASRDVGATLDAFSQMAKAREPESLAPRLKDLRFPIRLVLGAAPHVGGPSEAEVELLRQSLPSFSVTRVPGAGHFLWEEAPDAVMAVVGAVLTSLRVVP